MTAKIPVWLDVDTGHDDVFAILLAGHHPKLDLLGISATHGNAPTINTTTNTSSILTAIGRSDVVVYPGTTHPFCRKEVESPLAEIHGTTGLSGVTLIPDPKAPIGKANAIVAMRDALMSQPKGTAWLVATGSLTNPALLFSVFPEVAEHLGGLSIMGGAIGGGFTNVETGNVKTDGDGADERFGNETPWAEFNVYVDPESSRSIFMNPVLAPKTTLIPLDLTHQCLATKEVRQFLLHGKQSGTPSHLRRLLEEILSHFAASYDEFFDMSSGPPLHDPLAVAAIFGFRAEDSSLADNVEGRANDETSSPVIYQDDHDRYEVRVVTAGEHSEMDAVRGQVGRTIVSKLATTAGLEDSKEQLGFPQGVRIPRKMNTEAFWNVLEECCSIAESNGAIL